MPRMILAVFVSLLVQASGTTCGNAEDWANCMLGGEVDGQSCESDGCISNAVTGSAAAQCDYLKLQTYCLNAQDSVSCWTASCNAAKDSTCDVDCSGASLPAASLAGLAAAFFAYFRI